MENQIVVKSDDANALANLAALGEPMPLATEKTFADMSKGGDYFARLQLSGSSSKLCKRGAVAIGTYTFVVSDSNFTDLTKQVDILPMAWRPKALDMRGDTPVALYNPQDPLFIEVQELSGEKDSNCMYGPEFLVWIPKLRQFATLMLGSNSARRESKPLRDLIFKGATLTVDNAKKGKYEWQVIVVNPCTTPLELPGQDEAKAAMTKFKKETEVKAPEAAPEQSRAR